MENKPIHSRLRTVDQFMTRPLGWVWDGLIPRGKLTLITGEEGVGKSLVTLQVATSVSLGRLVPVPPPHLEQKYPPCPDMVTSPGAVVLVSGHDDVSDTIRPRLEAAGADLSRIYLRGDPDHRSQGAERDLDELEADLRELIENGVDLRLIVIDPIDSYLGSLSRKSDRAVLVNRLSCLAAWTGAAVLVVASCQASQTGRVGFRTVTRGHRELANAARSVLMVAHDLERDDQRILFPLKLSLSESRAGISFSLHQGTVVWNAEPVTMTGENYSYQSREKAKNPLVMQEQSALNRATEWLFERLKTGGDKARAVAWDAQNHEIAYPTLRRAFKKLGGVASKLSGRDGKWYWRLPQEVYTPESIRREDYAEALAETQLNFAYQWRGNFTANPPAPPLVVPTYEDDLILPTAQDVQGAQDDQDVQQDQQHTIEIPRVIQVYRQDGELKFGLPGDEIDWPPDDMEDDQGAQQEIINEHEMV